MKLPYIISIIILLLFSCKNSNSKTTANCKKKDLILTDTIFSSSEILSSIYYNDECQIEKLKLYILLDNRSGYLTSKSNLIGLQLTLGFYPDTLAGFFIDKDKTSIFNDNNSILQIEHEFEKPFLDSLNFVNLETISYDITKTFSQTTQSYPYFYNSSKSILEVENTYLDYKAFTKTNVHYKNISKSKSNIDSILITVKPNKDIDEITKYNIVINDTLSFKFRNSIIANFQNFKTKNKNARMYHLLKNDKNFTSFKLDLSKLKLNKINLIRAELN